MIIPADSIAFTYIFSNSSNELSSHTYENDHMATEHMSTRWSHQRFYFHANDNISNEEFRTYTVRCATRNMAYNNNIHAGELGTRQCWCHINFMKHPDTSRPPCRLLSSTPLSIAHLVTWLYSCI